MNSSFFPDELGVVVNGVSYALDFFSGKVLPGRRQDMAHLRLAHDSTAMIALELDESYTKRHGFTRVAMRLWGGYSRDSSGKGSRVSDEYLL